MSLQGCETFKGKATVRWQLLPSFSHQSVSEGQWKEYYEERETIELDGLGANQPSLQEPEIDSDVHNPRAAGILISARARIKEILHECGYEGISYARSINSLVYLLPFTGEHDGSDPRTITIATVFYTPYQSINYLTLSYERHHKDQSITLSCELSDSRRVPLVEISSVDQPGGSTLRGIATTEDLTRVRHFIFGDNFPAITPWKVFELLLGASAIENFGQDMAWLIAATESGLISKYETGDEETFKHNFFVNNIT